MDIKFGTDGWRDILGQGFNGENVERLTIAIGKYVLDNFGYDKPILIGYDPRKSADEYAGFCANVLKAKGFNVFFSSEVVPTPILAYNAKIRNACAIMFTASHNPPEYLGMKFIPDYAGPATSDITDEIINNLDKGFKSGENGAFHKINFGETYYEHIDKLIDFEKIKKLKTNIIFDGLYSSSIGYFDEILKNKNIPFHSLHMYHDFEFGGGMPDPKPRFLKDLITKVKNNPNSIGLANDGDADRFGVINENGEYVSPNEIIAILLKYLVKKGYTGSVVKTVGSSLLIDIIAKKMNIEVIETPVGFKYIGEEMRKGKVIIGGEESGGLSIEGHIPEKDGILANLLILEAMADSEKSLIELQEDIYQIAENKFYNDRIDIKLDSKEEIKFILEKVKTFKTVGKYNITSIDTKDGIKLMLGQKTKILVRPSGTEPLLRIYFETNSLEKLEYLKEEFVV